MKAFIVDRYGKKARGRIGELPDPKLRENDVLVQVYAAGVNLLDSKIRSGEFKLILPYRLPLILGNDVAGVVVQIGPRVRRFKIGDKVYARPPQDRIGSFAELISMNEDAVAMIPKKLTMEEAASIPLVALTAWQALIERANLKKGQKVLIHAGSGGVGTIAIQLAKHLGATVATTTSTANLDLVKSMGADIAIDYKTTDRSAERSGLETAALPGEKTTGSHSAQTARSCGCRLSDGDQTPEALFELFQDWQRTHTQSSVTVRMDLRQ